MQNEEGIDFMDITQVLRAIKGEGEFIQIERDGAQMAMRFMVTIIVTQNLSRHPELVSGSISPMAR